MYMQNPFLFHCRKKIFLQWQKTSKIFIYKIMYKKKIYKIWGINTNVCYSFFEGQKKR